MVDRGHVAAIGRTELRRRWRVLQGNAAQLLAIGFLALFAVPLALAIPVGAYFLGAELASGGVERPVEPARVGLVSGWLLVAGFGGYRAYATALRPDRLDAYLTTVSHRELLAGLLLAEGLLWGVPAVLAGTIGALAFAAGATSVLAAPVLVLTVCLALATALATGALLALAVRNAGARSKLLARLRTVLFVLLGLAYFGILMTQSFATVLEPLSRALEPTPVGWYGDLALVAVASEASLGRSIGAVLASGGFLLGSAVALPRLAAWLWYTDGVHVEHEPDSSPGLADASRLSALLPQSVLGVVAVDWKRGRRAPIALSFAFYPLLLLLGPAATAVRTGTIESGLPVWTALVGAWIAGALFALNVVGNEGAALPVTLLGSSPGRALVAGHVVAGALPVVPVAVVAVIGLGLASPQPATAVVTLAASALALGAAAGPIAAGIGAVFPRFETVSVSRSTEAIVPSTLAFVAYSLVLAVVALPTLAAHSSTVGHAIASAVGPSWTVLRVVGTAISAAMAAGVALLSGTYAIRAVESYALE